MRKRLQEKLNNIWLKFKQNISAFMSFGIFALACQALISKQQQSNMWIQQVKMENIKAEIQLEEQEKIDRKTEIDTFKKEAFAKELAFQAAIYILNTDFLARRDMCHSNKAKNVKEEFLLTFKRSRYDEHRFLFASAIEQLRFTFGRAIYGKLTEFLDDMDTIDELFPFCTLKSDQMFSEKKLSTKLFYFLRMLEYRLHEIDSINNYSKYKHYREHVDAYPLPSVGSLLL